MPFTANGATLNIERSSSDLSVGDVVVARVVLDTEGQDINSIDGEISINTNVGFVIKAISVAGSDFTLWPRSPSISESGKIISYTGGIPKGIKSSRVNVFSVVLEVEKKGEINIAPQNTFVFLNDGKGTKLETQNKNITIVSSANLSTENINEWDDIVLSDKTSPASFEIIEGKDDSLFSNKTFITFNTTDKESGIDYFEVTEGEIGPVRSSSPYVLQNQDTDEKIIVTAFDRAGNKTVSVYEIGKKSYTYTMLVVFALVVLVLVFVWYKKRKNEFI